MSEESNCGCCCSCSQSPPWWVTMGFVPPLQNSAPRSTSSTSPPAGGVMGLGGAFGGVGSAAPTPAPAPAPQSSGGVGSVISDVANAVLDPFSLL